MVKKNKLSENNSEGLQKQLQELENKYDILYKQFNNLTIEVEDLKKENGKTEVKKIVKKSKKEKDPNTPKKYSNAYIHFCNQYRVNHSEEKDIIKKASKEWNKIKGNIEKRKEYDNMAKIDKERYEKEINK